MWALCHVGSTPDGHAQLPSDMVSLITTLAEKAPLLSLRGTCIYALGLLAMTKKGREDLTSMQWQCITNLGDR